MKHFLTNRAFDDFGFNFFDNALDDFFKPMMAPSRHDMRTDVKESENGYDIAIDMPGFDKKDIN